MARQKALLIGIDNYADPRNNLPSCVADTEAFKRLLVTHYDFSDENVRSLHDGQAVIEEVEKELDWLFEGAEDADRLIFFYSGHGYYVPRAESFEEVLVLHDGGFLEDDKLSARTQAVPAGTLTIVLDSCFSGGMQKFIFPAEAGELEIARSKVWSAPPELERDLASAILALNTVKPFLRDLTTAHDTLVKDFQRSTDEEGQLQVNALLHGACQDTETASASSVRTNGLSAFTWALVTVIGERGMDLSSLELHEAAKEKLKTGGFRQTPKLVEPLRPQGLALRSFITMQQRD
jgi:hypothetical protein